MWILTFFLLNEGNHWEGEAKEETNKPIFKLLITYLPLCVCVCSISVFSYKERGRKSVCVQSIIGKAINKI